MVTKIVIGKSIRGILRYNESKVISSEATLLLANGFAGEVNQMNFETKLQRFQHLIELKPSVKTNALHITLNFDVAEKLDEHKMQQIAMSYMDRVGFGDQPYLVYRHCDVAHQHLHIVTTCIRRDGTSINLHNIGRTLSEPARKAVEEDFGLIRAESKSFKPEPGIKAADPEKALYGRLPTKRVISNVVTAVMNSYSYTSLAEFNAVLKQFNVVADRGKENTEMFRKKGLVYFLLDRNGNKTGVPIKASDFYHKPTLRNIEKKFETNEEKRRPHKRSLAARLDRIFQKYSQLTQNTLISELRRSGISLILRQNEQGLIYGATFIDHDNKTVFNGSDLGKAYSAKSITERLGTTDQPKVYLKPTGPQRTYFRDKEEANTYVESVAPVNYLKDLLNSQHPDTSPMLPKKKKRLNIKR
ncbi:relaxase/mobilization nuclease domain-containing protein [Daejeonella sp. JGW-45]|uniref:relaxase/mobilization nuclease domain-containing protein n=1 Tax=Daejeonella sp. JGW-45 TaxID=3034148 RepID=UPI0023EABC5B|nr:relaxase/mobilization nuclease domain-containing protein [Daejeonella sp. JGW-45]